MKKLLLTIFYSVASLGFVISQDSGSNIEEVKGQVEGINESLNEIRSTVDALKKIKVSGYMQSQYQFTDTAGAASVAGGAFPAISNDRIMIRRGRIKFNYATELTNYVIQFDVTEDKLSAKDVYFNALDPWTKSFTLQGGLFNRPFGYEIEYSSSSRETPERSRLFQTLFPGERDLGAMIKYAPEKGFMQYVNIKAGIFTGNGIAKENDKNKDFIGRLGFKIPVSAINMSFDGGVSGYYGAVRKENFVTTKNRGNFTYENEGTVLVITDSSLTKIIKRQYLGGDVQVYYNIPVIGGGKILAEYIQGVQPGTKAASSVYQPAGNYGTQDLYLRNFAGYYVTIVQNFGKSLSGVFRYDVYDPNTKVKGEEIGVSGSNTTAADVKFTTKGVGIIFHYDANLKFTVFYDMIQNEKTSYIDKTNKVYLNRDLPDNVFTLRAQYKF